MSASVSSQLCRPETRSESAFARPASVSARALAGWPRTRRTRNGPLGLPKSCSEMIVRRTPRGTVSASACTESARGPASACFTLCRQNARHILRAVAISTASL